MKPILFNTEMVKAILKDRKTTTRRLVKVDLSLLDYDKNDSSYAYLPDKYGDFHHLLEYSKIKIGDVLYVRETWMIQSMKNYEKNVKFLYKAEPRELNEVNVSEERYNDLLKFECKNGWQPSLFMPKEAARIFLKVTNIKVERLQDIDDEGALDEGITKHLRCKLGYASKNSEEEFNFTQARDTFKLLWNTTVNKKDLDKYGWNANPYVWVIEFERISKEEALNESNSK